MNRVRTILGGLECQIVDDLPSGASPSLMVVICHGYGASGQDLVPLGPELLSLQPSLAAGVRFVFPAAPLSLGASPWFDSRAWWHLDMARIERAMATGGLRDMRSEVPDGLTDARRMLRSAIDELQRSSGLPMERFVLGGFSQGAMLVTDVTLRLEEAPAALVIMSGTLLCEEDWRRRAPQRAGLRVLQSHGQLDVMLPYAGAEWLRDLLMGAGLSVEFIPFRDGHTVAPQVLVRFADLLVETLGARAPVSAA